VPLVDGLATLDYETLGKTGRFQFWF
jgi:hypothetical protein